MRSNDSGVIGRGRASCRAPSSPRSRPVPEKRLHPSSSRRSPCSDGDDPTRCARAPGVPGATLPTRHDTSGSLMRGASVRTAMTPVGGSGATAAHGRSHPSRPARHRWGRPPQGAPLRLRQRRRRRRRRLPRRLRRRRAPPASGVPGSPSTSGWPRTGHSCGRSSSLTSTPTTSWTSPTSFKAAGRRRPSTPTDRDRLDCRSRRSPVPIVHWRSQVRRPRSGTRSSTCGGRSPTTSTSASPTKAAPTWPRRYARTRSACARATCQTSTSP